LYNIFVVWCSFITDMVKEELLRRLGLRIRKIRTDKGITQQKLAHGLGKDQQSVQRLEAGNVNPSYYYLHEIATGLGTTVADLIDLG